MTRLLLLSLGLITALGYGFACAGSSDNDDELPVTTAAGGGGSGGGPGGAAGTGGGGGPGGSGGSGAGGCLDPDDVVLAMDRLYFGDIDFNNLPDANAWRQLGHNLDGLNTVGVYANHCQPAAGASTAMLDDGDVGIDNSFGRNVMPIFNAQVPQFSSQANQIIASGDFTLMLKLDDLGTGLDQDPLITKLYTGAPLGASPAFDGSDCWPVVQEQLVDPTDIESAQVIFSDSSLAGNAWDSGSTATVIIPLSILGAQATLTIYHARLTTFLDSAHQSASLGRLGGVLDTEEFVEEVRKVVAAFNQDYCGPSFEALADALRQASDIMQDGTQDPSAICNGISIGLGFTMVQVGLGGIAEAQPAPPDPCAE